MTMDCTLSAHDTLVDWLIGRIAGYLATIPAAVDTDKAFGDYGLDSAFALNLCTDLEAEFGILVEPTVAWDYPTIDDMAGYLATQTRRVP
jgi:acyl carrier protein